ncbi:MAG: putative sulfate exporter family transporter [Bacteroidia bacterium]|nr:putative sulfate exporter family transporter [Bacteroidia bacterium]
MVIGIAALLLANVIPLLGSIVLGLLLGIIVGNSYKLDESFSKGINYTSGKMLEFSLLFLALGINFSYISKIGYDSFLFLSLVVLIVLLISYLYSKKYSVGKATYLVGFGTAICGSSAIAAVAPSIKSDKEDIGISLAVVNLLGTIGMLVLPLLLGGLGLDAIKSGFVIGGSLHSVANVAGAGYAINEETFRIAITVKLARVALLSPALILYSYLIKKDSVKNWKDHFKLPWYVWSFIGITILSSLIQVPEDIIKSSELIGKIILTIAMAAIGLKVSFKTLFLSGKKAMLFGSLLFVIDVILLLIISLNR